MQNLIQQARKRAGMTQEQTAKAMFVGLRQYQRFEYGEQEMTPEEALRLSKILDFPTFTMAYCRRACAIGKRYCFELLNNVDLSPTGVLTKYRQEEREANEALQHLSEILLNKKCRDDCTEAELGQIWRWSHEMLDVEHVIETLKMQLWDFIDVAALVREHNMKCHDKRYVDREKPDLQVASR